MGDDWKAGFKQAMVKALVDGGQPVRDRPDIYGWQNYEPAAMGRRGRHPLRIMIEQVGIDFDVTTYRESVWDEFMGTFYEGDTRVYGTDMDLVLLDGTRLHWRYAGTLSALISAVLAE